MLSDVLNDKVSKKVTEKMSGKECEEICEKMQEMDMDVTEAESLGPEQTKNKTPEEKGNKKRKRCWKCRSRGHIDSECNNLSKKQKQELAEKLNMDLHVKTMKKKLVALIPPPPTKWDQAATKDNDRMDWNELMDL